MDALNTYNSCVREPLAEAIDALFNDADSALMKLAMKTADNHEQNRHFDEVLDVRISRPEIGMRFIEDVLGDGSALPFGASSDAQDSEQVESLMGMLANDPRQWQQTPALFAALSDLSQRHGMLEWPSMPLEPVSFCRKFMAALALVPLSMHCKMLLVRLFETRLYQNLQDFARNVNEYLIAYDVLPSLKTAQPPLDQSMNQIVERELNRRAMYTSAGDHVIEILLEEAQVDAFENVDDLLADETLFGLSEPLAATDWLTIFRDAEDWPDTVSDELAAQIQIVERLQGFFSGLLQDDEMPLMARYLVNQLQLPYLRLVLADSRFFS